jgi:hypothetical protein
MSNNLYKFQNGICGYAPQGSVGSSGKDGYSVHYSSFDSSEDSINSMILLIKQKKVLSTNPNYGVGQVINYKIGDVIITIDAMMLRISNSDDSSISDDNISNCTIKKIGSIKIIYDDGEGEDIFNGINIEYKINSSPIPVINDYNYIDNGASPLYHHRDTNDRYCYGNSIHLYTPSDFATYLNKMDNHMCKFVLNFISGLRIEKVITSENYNNSIFIDNRYLYPFGHRDASTMWDITAISSYNEEKDTSTSVDLKSNITTSDSKCMCSGYISFHVNNKEYIKKITIS